MYPSSFSYYCLWYSNRWNQISGRMTHYMIENVVSCFTESKMTVSQPLHFTPSAIKTAPLPVLRNRCCSANPRGQRLCPSSRCILGSPRAVSRKDIFPSTFPTLALLSSPLPSSHRGHQRITNKMSSFCALNTQCCMTELYFKSEKRLLTPWSRKKHPPHLNPETVVGGRWSGHLEPIRMWGQPS